MTATNELDAALCQEELPDEFSRLSSSSSPRDRSGVAFLLSGIVTTCQQDDVTCPLMLRRHLVVQAWSRDFAPGVRHHV